MMISVIIPAFNVEKYITDCIESVQNQSFKDIEIICVDDASTDGTWGVLESLSKHDSRIRILRHTVNSGAAKSRNDGCRASSGKYIYFLDADDLIKPKAFEILIEVAEKWQSDVLSFSGEYFFDEDFEEKHTAFKPGDYIRTGRYEGVYKGYELLNLYYENSDFNGNLCFQFIQRDFFMRNALFFNEDLKGIDDSPFAIYMAAERAMCIPDVLYRRRYRENSQMTAAMSGTKLESLVLTYFLDLMAWQSVRCKENTDCFNGLEHYFNSTYYRLKDETRSMFREGCKFRILDKYPAAKYFLEYFIMEKPRYAMFTNEVIEELRISKAVILYGAGIVAKRIAHILEMENIDDYTVVVSEKNGDLSLGKKKVYAVNESGIVWENAIVIVAISKVNRSDILEKLNNKPVNKIIWIE